MNDYTRADTYRLAREEVDRCEQEEEAMVLITSRVDPVTKEITCNFICNVNSTPNGIQAVKDFVQAALIQVAGRYGN